jgi:hypothetical protein
MRSRIAVNTTRESGYFAYRRQTGSNRRKTQEPLESSTIFEPVVTVARLVFSVPLYLLTWLRLYRIDLPSSVGQPFSAAYFSGHCFRLIPASGSFAASAFPVPPLRFDRIRG